MNAEERELFGRLRSYVHACQQDIMTTAQVVYMVLRVDKDAWREAVLPYVKAHLEVIEVGTFTLWDLVEWCVACSDAARLPYIPTHGSKAEQKGANSNEARRISTKMAWSILKVYVEHAGKGGYATFNVGRTMVHFNVDRYELVSAVERRPWVYDSWEGVGFRKDRHYGVFESMIYVSPYL